MWCCIHYYLVYFLLAYFLLLCFARYNICSYNNLIFFKYFQNCSQICGLCFQDLHLQDWKFNSIESNCFILNVESSSSCLGGGFGVESTVVCNGCCFFTILMFFLCLAALFAFVLSWRLLAYCHCFLLFVLLGICLFFFCCDESKEEGGVFCFSSTTTWHSISSRMLTY